MERIAEALEACPDDELRRLLAAAARAALTGGAIIRDLYGRPHTIRMKGEIDLVTEADLSSETAIIASLDEDAPGIDVMAEESYDPATPPPEGRTWVIDPLDGTTNFAHSIPIFAVSIGLLEEKRPLLGVIYCPMQDELFTACRGGGARLNDREIQVTDTGFPVQALVATGFPYDIHSHLDRIIAQTRSVLPRVRDIRRCGAAAVDLAYVACGRFDGFWEMDLKPWDTAAGCLLVEEAGGRVSDFAGGPYTPFLKEILASNTALHQQLLEMIT
ncbi:MAG: inositol monophosphatase family protein [Desulfobulbaceae bacterium]